MDEKKKLYDVLVREGYFTKSYDEFDSKWNDESYRDKVYGVVSRDGLYTKDRDSFMNKYGVEVKKKDVQQSPQIPSQNGGVAPIQEAGSVGSLVGGLAPTPQDIASQSAGGNVASPVVLPEPTKINEANIPIQGVGGNVPVNIQASNIPKVSLDKQNIQPSVVEGIQSPEPIEVPTEDIRNRFETEWGDQGDALRLQEEQKYFESGKKSDLDKVISDIYSEIKSNYTVNEIREGKHIDNAKAQFSDFVNAHKDEIPVSLRNRYIIEAGKLFEDISKQKKEEQTQERIVRNIDNEAFDLGEINDAGFTKFNEDYKSGKVKNSDLIWNDLFYQQNPEKALQLYKDLTGEDFVSDNLIPELQFDDVALAKEAVDKMREYSLQNKRKSIDRKIIDLAISTGNKENINQFVDDYKSELVKQAIGYEPLMEKWDSLKEYYRLAGKKDKTEADNKKMIELTKSINQNTENVFYDINTQDWVNKRNDTGLASENWNKYKAEIANTYSGNKAMSNLFKDIEKVSAELEYLKPILADQKSATKQTIKNTSFARGIVNPNEYIQEKLTNALTPEDAQYDTHQYDPMNQSDIANRISELKTRLNAMVEILIENKNPNNNPEAGFLDGLFNTDAVKIQEDNKKIIREANRLGHNLTEADLDYLEDDFSKKLGSTVRESLPVGAEIMFNLAVGNKVKGVVGLVELTNRLYKGNKYKKLLANLIDKGYNVFNQEMAFQSAGENVGTGTGELVFENIAEKIMPKGWNKVTKLITRMVAGTTGETLAEYGGKFTSELVDGKSLKDAWDITTEGGIEELLLTAASSFIMAGAPATLNVFGENVNSDGVNEGNLLKLKSELENVSQKSEATEDFIRTVDESYPEDVIQRQGEKFFTESNIELYADILEKPKEEWTDDEVMFINGMDGFYDSAKDLLPKDEVKLFELFKDKFDNRGEEIKSPQDKLQDKRDQIADIEQQKTEKNDQENQERVSGEVKVGEEPIKEKPIEETGSEEIETGGVLQEQWQEQEVVEPKDGDTITKPPKIEGGQEQYYKYNESKGSWEQVSSSGEFMSEIGDTRSQNLTEEFINQKQAEYESKRVNANKETVGSSEQAVPSEERIRVEQTNDKTTGIETTTEPTRRGVTGQEQENVTGESVTQETEGKSITSPPPEMEMGETSVELDKGAISIEGKGSSKSLAIIGEGVNENLLSTKEDVEQAKSLYEKRGWYISEQLGFGGVITVFAKDKKTLKSIIDKKYHDKIDSTELKKEKSIDEKKIKESGKKIAEAIRSKKFVQDMTDLENLRNDPTGVFKGAWDGSLEVLAKSIEVSGNVAQAVLDAVSHIKKSDWYKGLSDEGKSKADKILEQKFQEQAVEAEKLSVKITEPKSGDGKKVRTQSKRLGTQTEFNEDVRKGFIDRGKYTPKNNEDLYSSSESLYNDMKDSSGNNILEMQSVADSSPMDVRKVLYGFMVQDAHERSLSKDPEISKKGLSDLNRLGDKMAELSTEEGRGVQANKVVYEKFPMFAYYRVLSEIDKINEKTQSNGVTKEDVRKNFEGNIEEAINEISKNIDQAISSEKFKDIYEKAKKAYSRKTNKKLSPDKKAELADKKRKIKDKFFGRTGKLQAGVPFGDQVVAMVEYAAVLIEEGYYKISDIVNQVREDLRLQDMSRPEIETYLTSLEAFRELQGKERSEKFSERLSEITKDYLTKSYQKALEGNVTSSEKNTTRNEAIDNLVSEMGMTKEEAEGTLNAIDQEFKDKVTNDFKDRVKSYGIREGALWTEADRLAKNANKKALDAIEEIYDMSFREHKMINTESKTISKKLQDLAMKVQNSKPGVLRNEAIRELETFIHETRGAYGFGDWLLTRFYGSILSGPVTHIRNMKYNVVAIGLMAPITQIYTKGGIDFRNTFKAYNDMMKSFKNVDGKVVKHYWKTGDNFVDRNTGPKTYAENREMHLLDKSFGGKLKEILAKGTTRLLNKTSTRALVASDLALTKPLASAVYTLHVKKWLKTQSPERIKEFMDKYDAKNTNDLVSKMMGYTEENVDKSSKQAERDVKDFYGDDNVFDSNNKKLVDEANILKLLRTQERILENSGIEQNMGEAWYDSWSGENILMQSEAESKNFALQGEVLGIWGAVTDLAQKATNFAPVLKTKIPFTSIIGNMMNMAMKWTPVISQIQPITRYAVNKYRLSKGMDTTSSTTLAMLQAVGMNKIFDTFNKGISKEQSTRDLKNMIAITAVQGILYSLISSDEDEDGLVVTGMLDPKFYTAQNITKGTGITPFSLYYRSNGKLSKILEYKNSAFGYMLAPYGVASDAKSQGKAFDNYELFKRVIVDSPFVIADKPAAMALKEIIESLQLTDRYGNTKIDAPDFWDKFNVGAAGFFNSVFVPNLLKQSNKVVEQSFGLEAKRAVNWQDAIVKGVPYLNQNVLETQYDHFGRPIYQKLEFGYAGLTWDYNKGGFSVGQKSIEESIDPYYALFTNHPNAETYNEPKYFTYKKVDVYNKDGSIRMVDTPSGKKAKDEMQVSKSEAHEIHRRVGVELKTAIDKIGLDKLNEIPDFAFNKVMSSLYSNIRKKVVRDMFMDGVLEYSEDKTKKKQAKSVIKNK